MKKIYLVLALLFSVMLTLQSAAQNQDGFGNVVGTTDVIVSDIPRYVAALKADPQAFAIAGFNLVGFCQAVSGGVPGEGLVFSFSDSMEANLQAVEIQLTDSHFQRFVATLAPYRELTGTRQARVLRPHNTDGLTDTWATRSLYVSTNDQQAYIAALGSLESAVRANGFQDFSIAVSQEVGSGDTSDLLAVVVLSSSLARLGASIDAILEESWAQAAFANVVGARSQITDDKFYRCDQVYPAN